MTLALVCTLAVQIWINGHRDTLRLDDVQCVEFADKENDRGLLVNCARDPQFQPYEVLTSMPMRVNPNDCQYTEDPTKYSKQWQQK